MKPGSKKSKDEIKDKIEQQIQINNKYVKFDDAAKKLNISEKDLTIILYKCPRIIEPIGLDNDGYTYQYIDMDILKDYLKTT